MLNSQPKSEDNLTVKQNESQAGDRQSLKPSTQNDKKQPDGVTDRSTTECKPGRGPMNYRC
jgi:hypothetical protein